MKKILTILFIIMLFITVIQFKTTYALYKTKLSDELQVKLGIWSVKVNGTDISSGNADMSFEITDEYLCFQESEYIDGINIAPGCEGYFDLLVDATNTDVSIKYAVEIPESATLVIGEDEYSLENVVPFELTGVEDVFEKNGEIDTTTSHINYVDLENKIAYGVIPLSVIENGYKGRIRVKFKWIDDGDNELDTMLGNDEIGTNLGFSTGDEEIDQSLAESETKPKISIPVSIQLTQYMGENLTPAVGTPQVTTP